MTSPPAPVTRRPRLVAAAACVLATAMALPFSHHQLDASTTFVTAMLVVVACFEFTAVYLLIGDYRAHGDPRLLAMSCAFAWSLTVMGGYALAFPGAVTVHPLLAVTPSVAPYLYLAWHCGFPAILSAAWAPWPKRWIAPTPQHRRRAVSSVTLAATLVIAALLVTGVVAFARRLPVLIKGVDTHRMTTLTAPIAMPLVLAALLVALRGTRNRSGPERWSSIVILVCLCDLTLTYYSRSRFSLGWYCGRTLTLVSAAVVTVVMLDSLRKMKTRAEHDAAHDQLTGLGNRRTAALALDQLVARSRRSGVPLGVLSLDLDHFKRINDQYGHETGDAVLVETGRLLLGSCRAGDVVARVGGEEFLVLLPDTDRRGTIIVAEKMLAAVAEMQLPIEHGQVTASLGLTAFRPSDLNAMDVLRRADSALYCAKNSGRNCMVEAPIDIDDTSDDSSDPISRPASLAPARPT